MKFDTVIKIQQLILNELFENQFKIKIENKTIFKDESLSQILTLN